MRRSGVAIGHEPEDVPFAGGEGEVSGARSALRGAEAQLFPATLLVIGTLTFLATWIASRVVSTQPWLSFVAVTIAVLMGLPVLVIARRGMERLVSATDAAADERQRRQDDEGRHRDFDSRIADALEMVDNEDEALQVIARAFEIVVADRPVELLLADNSHAHLSRVVFTAPAGEPPGCGVASPDACPAARRARTHYFPDSSALNACPKLAGRSVGRCAALCIPVSVMGRTVGVIHTIGQVAAPLEATAGADLQSLANQAGARLGMLRIMNETQLQASTDGLTGLLNRRAFENGFLGVRQGVGVSAIAMADLDQFKMLNDTYGHDTGDRALRTFAEALRSRLRVEDLVSRRGGEEFAIFFPRSDAAAAVAGLQRVQLEFQRALTAAGLPACTASFGVVEAATDEALDTMLARADAALFAAKHAGRDRIIVHDRNGQERLYPATVFPNETRLGRTAPPQESPAIDRT